MSYAYTLPETAIQAALPGIATSEFAGAGTKETLKS